MLLARGLYSYCHTCPCPRRPARACTVIVDHDTVVLICALAVLFLALGTRLWFFRQPAAAGTRRTSGLPRRATHPCRPPLPTPRTTGAETARLRRTTAESRLIDPVSSPTSSSSCTAQLPSASFAMKLFPRSCRHTGRQCAARPATSVYAPRHGDWCLSSPDSTRVVGGGSASHFRPAAALHRPVAICELCYETVSTLVSPHRTPVRRAPRHQRVRAQAPGLVLELARQHQGGWRRVRVAL